MCYPCTQCGRCGKFNEDSPLYTPPPEIPCLRCGGVVDADTGVCASCGQVAFRPVGKIGLAERKKLGGPSGLME